MKFHTHVRYEFYRHSLSVGYKTEFAFDHFLDVDSPDGGAVWITNYLTGHGLKSQFNLKLFFSCIIAKVTHFNAMASLITYKQLYCSGKSPHNEENRI